MIPDQMTKSWRSRRYELENYNRMNVNISVRSDASVRIERAALDYNHMLVNLTQTVTHSLGPIEWLQYRHE